MRSPQWGNTRATSSTATRAEGAAQKGSGAAGGVRSETSHKKKKTNAQTNLELWGNEPVDAAQLVQVEDARFFVDPVRIGLVRKHEILQQQPDVWERWWRLSSRGEGKR